jgi:succinate dehydrogenase/fumarate reductase-like Fe-S protein
VKRLVALLLLGLRALVLHPFRALFTPAARKGKRGFLANYGPEALVPMSAGDRAELWRFSGCVNCGLCDAVCPLVGRLPPADWRGPSLFALAYSRATPELPHLRATVSALDGCGPCHACQDICPRAVPLLAIFAFTRRKLAEVDAARAPANELPAADEQIVPAPQPGLGT